MTDYIGVPERCCDTGDALKFTVDYPAIGEIACEVFASILEGGDGKFIFAYFTSLRRFVGFYFICCGLNGVLLFVDRGFFDIESSEANRLEKWL